MTCECGCGHVVTEGKRFCKGHYSRTAANRQRARAAALARRQIDTTGICECGCGQQTALVAPKSFRRQRFRSGHNSYGMKRGEGRYVNNFGYVMLRMPDHPNAQKGYVLEHRYLMEQTLGRPLERGEVVHHLNGDKADNRPENLSLESEHSHGSLHGRPKGIPHSEEHKRQQSERMNRIWEERRAGLRPLPKH